MRKESGIIIAAALASIGATTGASAKTPDFNYPKTVSATAETDLQSALKSNDGKKVVDAMVRYSIAQSIISSDNMAGIMNRLDSVKSQERRPEYRSMLCYFEAIMLKQYGQMHGLRTKGVEGARPADYSEWSREQLLAAADSLIEESVANEAALRGHTLEEFGTLIADNTPESRLYCPTLLDFMLLQGMQAASNKQLKNKLKDKLISNNPANSALGMDMRLLGADNDKAMELWRSNKESEFSALALLQYKGIDNKAIYGALQEYARSFPESRYINGIKNRITQLETKKLNISYARELTPTDTVKVKVELSNLKDFKLNVYSVPAKEGDRYGNLKRSELKLVGSTSHSGHGGTVPFDDTVTVQLPPLPYGIYVIAPEFEQNGKLVERNDMQRALLRVHNIAVMQFNRSSKGGNTLVTADLKTGAPIKGVKVNSKKNTLGTTDGNGVLHLDKLRNTGSWATLSAIKGDDKFSPEFSVYRGYTNAYTTKDASLFTDLAIYRPGEKIKYSGIVYWADQQSRRPCEGERVTVALCDPNGKEVARDSSLVTDAYGRIEGTFDVPTDRIMGTYRLEMLRHGGIVIRRASVQVNEYKAPTFAVELKDAKPSYNKGLPVAIKGEAKTYSGMAVANAKVRVKLYRSEWSWWWRGGSDEGDLVGDTTVITDENGQFAIEYPAITFIPSSDNSDEAEWMRPFYSYSLKAECTDAAGETQRADASFVIGSKRSVSLKDDHADLDASKPVKLPATYNSTVEGDTHAQCLYKLVTTNDESKTVATGNFDSANPVIDLTKVPSGRYKLLLSVLADTMAEPSEATVTLFRLTDSKAPVDNCQLWTAQAASSVDDADVAHITIGTSVPQSHIYYVASDRTGEVARGWLHYKPGMHELKLQIPAKENNILKVCLASVYGGEVTQRTLQFESKAHAHTTQLKVSSFRDRIVPGAPEKWQFKLVDNNGKPVAGALMLEVIDKAINSLNPNEWWFRAYYTNAYSINYSDNIDPTLNSYCNPVSWTGRMLNYSGNNSTWPTFNMYGQMPFYSFDLGSGMRPRMLLARANEAVYDSISLEETVVVKRKSNGAVKRQLDNVAVRENAVKTALWRPMLTTDAQGNACVEFEAPAQSTTWVMQAIAYDGAMASDVMTREIVAQKPIMVKPSLPRFVRQADGVTLTASVQNAADASASVTAVVEVFDPRTGKNLAEHTVERTLAAKASDTVSIALSVPAQLPYVGFRIRATNGSYSDGEQCMVPVLAAESPVVESTPFYIDAAKPQFAMQLPQFKSGSRVTLEYCDNPVWYCVLALPTIYNGENSHVATIVAHDLFAAAVAQGTAASHPEVAEAIKHWSSNADSTLTSMLQRNADLKIGTLLASPWISDAERQTLRMSRIANLVDEQKGKAAVDKLIDALAGLQRPDGGFTWFCYPGCSASVWTTGEVLELIGETQQLGYLKGNDKLERMVKRALQYYDAQTLKLYKQQTKRRPNDHSGFSSYAYTRTLFHGYKLGTENASMLQKVMRSLASEWKGASLSDKAFMAMTLWRNGNKAEARRITESIRQFATTNATGMHWDQLNNRSWLRPGNVAVTATIMRAISEVDGRKDEIDQVRKWMLLMKQSNDWGSSSLATDAVQALLATGSNWTGSSGSATATVGGKSIDLGNADKYLGYGRVSLDASVAGQQLQVARSGQGPAWGAVYAQYQAPMTQVKAAKTTDIEVAKQYLVYGAGGKLTPATTLHVGDKVQVRATIKVARDASYVTLTDERAACLEPADQTSGYRCAGGEWYYLESKDSATNAFFHHLGKGTHVLSYDAYVTAPGTFNSGIATVQCQYAPQVTAHSAGVKLKVSK